MTRGLPARYLSLIERKRVELMPGPAGQNYRCVEPRQARASESAARSISSDAVCRPSVSRTEPRASPTATPIARTTAEACSRPSWQADPVEAAISGAPAKSLDANAPGNRTLSVFGRRGSAHPLS